MDPLPFLVTAMAVVVIGGLIGSVGIGGMLLVPWLTQIVGLGVRESIGIAMAGFVVTGLVAAAQAWFGEAGDGLEGNWPLVLATLPGALLGAMGLAVVPEQLVMLLLAAFLTATGGWTLRRDRPARIAPARVRRGGLPLGFASGFASAMTGTGGPAVLVPAMLWRGLPVLAAVSIGQIAQLPIAAAATAGNVASGYFNPWAALLVGAALAPGVLVGRWLGLRLPVAVITNAVAVIMVLAGVAMAVRTLATIGATGAPA